MMRDPKLPKHDDSKVSGCSILFSNLFGVLVPCVVIFGVLSFVIDPISMPEGSFQQTTETGVVILIVIAITIALITKERRQKIQDDYDLGYDDIDRDDD